MKTPTVIKPLVVACIYFSRIPMPWQNTISAEETGRALLWLPVLGAMLGALIALGFGVSQTVFNPEISAALVLTLWVCATGGIHLDGLADSSDAWLGGFAQRERALAIMKDPRCGAAAVIFVGLLLLVKFAALSSLFSKAHETGSASALLALLLAPVLGRVSGLTLCTHTPCAREEGLSADFANHTPKRLAQFIALTWIIASIGLITVLLNLNTALLLLGLGIAIFYVLRKMMLKHLQGYTGDTCGALIELTEASCLLALAANL